MSVRRTRCLEGGPDFHGDDDDRNEQPRGSLEIIHRLHRRQAYSPPYGGAIQGVLGCAAHVSSCSSTDRNTPSPTTCWARLTSSQEWRGRRAARSFVNRSKVSGWTSPSSNPEALGDPLREVERRRPRGRRHVHRAAEARLDQSPERPRGVVQQHGRDALVGHAKIRSPRSKRAAQVRAKSRLRCSRQ